MIRGENQNPKYCFVACFIMNSDSLGNISPLGQLSQILHSNKSAMESLGVFFSRRKDLMHLGQQHNATSLTALFFF